MPKEKKNIQEKSFSEFEPLYKWIYEQIRKGNRIIIKEENLKPIYKKLMKMGLDINTISMLIHAVIDLIASDILADVIFKMDFEDKKKKGGLNAGKKRSKRNVRKKAQASR